jgi:hypothetical protein
VAGELIALAPDNLDCAFVDFSDLPLCSEDLDWESASRLGAVPQ